MPALDYPTCDDVRRVGRTGMLHLHGRKEMYLSPALAGEYVGLREDTEIADRWLVLFANLALGHVEPGSHHFTALPVSTPTRLAPGEA